MTEPSGGSGRPRRPVVVPAVALVLVTALGVTALAGGLSEAPDAPPQLGKGAVLDQGRFATRFVESRVRLEKAQTQFDQDKRFVELVFEVTNRGDDTASVGVPPSQENAGYGDSFGSSLVKISPPFPADSGPFAFALAKGGETGQLHPGIKTTVIVRYQLKEGRKPPEKVTLDVGSYEYVAGFNDPSERWTMITQDEGDKLVPEVKAQVTLPVQEDATA
ncbi:hypothetical protein MTP10_00545 [Nonomuraea sp. 3-1Str]|uniref:hypothetical protein n=1 Tax=Nonomuraea sp. 3-1Str TaxID=2929801 RepID=UPI002864D78D|nr:hypothetical protein [Nonomuraea sp. 3-1Str]MDR8407226.1 hypothetical protein [Nonomuraea sp. 3-1Str]